MRPLGQDPLVTACIVLPHELYISITSPALGLGLLAALPALLISYAPHIQKPGTVKRFTHIQKPGAVMRFTHILAPGIAKRFT
jgi:hypothetical protein